MSTRIRGPSPARHAEDHNILLPLYVSAQWPDTVGVPADLIQAGWQAQVDAYRTAHPRLPMASMMRRDTD